MRELICHRAFAANWYNFMPQANRDIVVVGASAGGVEALKTFFQRLPSDLPAAIFIVLHVWPSAKSFLPEILQRVSPLRIGHAVDGDRIEYGRVYIAPPDLHLFVEQGQVRIRRGPRENRCRPAINPLFRSAASAYGPRVIGVILSGTMDDGSAGLWAVAQGGGVTIVQNPQTAAFSEMPQSALDAVEVTHVAELEDIPGLIAKHAREKVSFNIHPSLPDLVKLNDASAKMEPMEMEIDKFGKRSVYGCPECGGALWEIKEGGQLSFRCHVGHAYSGKSLREEQDTVLEQSLWSALRALVESADLDERLAQRSEENELPKAAESYRRNAIEKRVQETHIRQFLLNLRPRPEVGDAATG